jgi:outer membrane protein TolC
MSRQNNTIFRIKKGLFITSLFFAVVSYAQDSLFIDFDTALNTVIKNNIDIQEAKSNWMVQSEAANGAYGEFEPHLTARAFKERGNSPSALFTETKEEYKIGIQGRAPTGTEYNVGFNQAGYTHSDYTSELYVGGELRQHLLKDGPLFNTTFINQRLANFQKEQAFQKYRETLSEILENFCDTYWNYYFAQQTLRFAEKSSSVASEIVEDARKRLKLGMLSMLDYQKAVAEYSDREGARLDALDKLRSARLSLLLILSSQELIRDLRPISIAPNTTLDSIAILDSLTYIDSISVLHPAYLMQNIEVEIRNTNLDKSKNKFLPTIDIIGNYGIRGRDKDAETALRKFRSSSKRQSVFAYGVEIDIPLFANLEERHQIAADKASVRSARSRLTLLQGKLYEEYRILQQRAWELRNQWKLSESAVAYHESELKEEFKKMELGKSNYHIIFEMEDDLRQAQQRHLECMKQLRIIDVRLIRATGKLLLQNGLESWKDGKITLRKDLLSD